MSVDDHPMETRARGSLVLTAPMCESIINDVASQEYESARSSSSDLPDMLSSPTLPTCALPANPDALPFPAMFMSSDNELDSDWEMGDAETGQSDALEDDTVDSGGHIPRQRRSATSDTEKIHIVLSWFEHFPKNFTVAKFIQIILTNPSFSAYARAPLADSAVFNAVISTKRSNHREEYEDWVITQSASICSKSLERITRRATRNQHANIAQTLRVSAEDVTLDFVRAPHIANLRSTYRTALPELYKMLTLTINKHEAGTDNDVAPAKEGIIMAISIILNRRSRRSNYHQVVNGLVLWENTTSKRVIQALNHYGISASHPVLLDASAALTKDIQRKASAAAVSSSKIPIFIYDNFNWHRNVYESSINNVVVSHDQVSALLVCLDSRVFGVEKTAGWLLDVKRFDERAGRRLELPFAEALEAILPSHDDLSRFAANAKMHVAAILREELTTFSKYDSVLPSDAYEIPAHKTEHYFLRPSDLPQSSTQDNIKVLEHFFVNELKIPKARFEDQMYFILGDRLTTARDRAAQDQRMQDRSPSRFDRFESFRLLSGLMHVCMNMILGMGKSAWGEEGSEDIVTLRAFRDLVGLEHLRALNLRKLDFYGWLRFLDTVGRALVIAAAVACSRSRDIEDLIENNGLDQAGFDQLCADIVDTRLMPSCNRLEALGVKEIEGPTRSGNAVILMHHLMTLREMRHAISMGHPSRILTILKHWMPMFYAAKSYNYAQEMMELLCNLIIEWPDDTSRVMQFGMLFNGQGRRHHHKEADIANEQYNKTIKSHIHGTNSSPTSLQTHAPAQAHLEELTDNLFDALGVQSASERHTKVQQHADIALMAAHLVDHRVFLFDARVDVKACPLTDLYRQGMIGLHGEKGGFAGHIARFKLRQRHRDGATRVEGSADWEILAQAVEDELQQDNLRVEHVISRETDV
ncbi:hypothetical protein CYLTODRAFT_389379 [Cylindrobasidium torrendii FP15055 ss-10]|uniref:DUF6589 domain-containing protein n=1 Tax=Cylindrobasidium torrendii FP15055 ss-10 TaxID=1314674 RepID=A0A0D7BNR1_9AGAR|nr:hypothetical protein CYLTODRAFT_389379 [Cylindrobasidium torrendii FP15055 ss-10]